MHRLLNNLFQSNKVIFLLLLFIAFACFFPSLDAPFKTLDDYPAIIDNSSIKDFSSLKEIFSTSFFGKDQYYRPLVYLSFMLEYHLFRLDSFYFNLSNLLLHVSTAFLLFLFISRLVNNRNLGFGTALMFLIHPINAKAVTNIPDRSILLCTLFFILTLYIFQSFASKGAKGNLFFYSLSLFTCILSMLSKESGVMIPFILLAYIFLVGGEDSGGIKRRVKWVIPYLFILAVYFAVRQILGITGIHKWPNLEAMFLGITSFLRAIFVFLQKILFPVNLYFDSSSPIFNGLSDPWIWVTSLMWLAILGLFFNYLKHIPKIILFLIIWIILNLAPVSQIVPATMPLHRITTADQFLYLPSMAIFLLLIIAGKNILTFLQEKRFINKTVGVFFICGFYAFLFIVTMQESIYASNQIVLYERSLNFLS